MRIRFTALALLALSTAAGCGTAEYNRRYEEQLKGLADMLQPEQARTKVPPGQDPPTVSVRMPKFIDGGAKAVASLPAEIQLPFPTQFHFGYTKTVGGAKPEDVEVAFVESVALKGDVIDKALPPLMRGVSPDNPEAVEKIEVKGPDGKPMAMRYYRGTFKFSTAPGNNNAPTIDKKIALYFYEQPTKTLAAIWIASAEADAALHFFDAARQSMGTLVYDANAKPKPGAAPAGAPAGAPAAAPAVPGAVPGVAPGVPAALPANK